MRRVRSARGHLLHRRFGLLRDVAVSLTVAAALGVVFEVALRATRPQMARTESVDGRSRAVEDSVLGHRYRPGSRAIHDTPEFRAEYEIDDHGWRSGTRYADSLGVRVLVLGDSSTFGDGVSPGDVWTSVCARSLAAQGLRADMMNAGIEGYDTRAEAHYLFELAPRVRPEVVVVAFLANDVYTNQPLEAKPASGVGEGGGREFELHSVAWAKRLVMQSDRLYARLFLVTSRKEFYATPVSERVTERLGVTRELFSAMEAYCRDRGIDLVVVSIPQQFAVLASARGFRFRGVDPDLIDANLAGLARERGFLWIQTLEPLADAYRNTGADMYYRVDGHLTAAGHRVVGEHATRALAQVLAKRRR